jgi:hypothetical protein
MRLCACIAVNLHICRSSSLAVRLAGIDLLTVCNGMLPASMVRTVCTLLLWLLGAAPAAVAAAAAAAALLQNEKEDPSMEKEGAHWNEMRAVLNTGNMVSS